MILDTHTLFSDDQAITASAASANVLDLGHSKNIAAGKPIEILVQVTTLFDSGANDGTLVVAVEQDTADTFGSATVLVQTAAIAEATMVAGYQFTLTVMPSNTEHYLRLYYTVAGSGNFTAGKITAGIILDRQTNNANV